MPNLEEWISKETIQSMYSSSYWNDIENEKQKAWWITDKNDQKLANHLSQTGLKQEIEFIMHLVKNKLVGNVLDAAAGTCWASALLSQNTSIQKIDAVEFSLHRIEILAPITIENLNGDSQKIKRILGSFYDIKKEAGYYDVILLSQAFHHAQYPSKLFHECDRVLKPEGIIIIMGEHIITPWMKVKKIVKSILHGKPTTNTSKLFYNHDDPLGDHCYRLSDYEFLFFSYGYTMQILKSKHTQSYILIGYKDK